MEIISWHEFESKSSSNGNQNQKIYNQRVINKGPIFSLQNKDVAIRYCQENKNNLCILVENKNYFQSWEEKKELVKTKTSSSSAKTESSRQEINEEFLALVKNILSEYIGPIAGIICKKTVTQNPNLTPQKLIDILAEKIPTDEDSSEFKNKLQKQLNQ